VLPKPRVYKIGVCVYSAAYAMLSEPSGPGQEDWMTFTVRLEQADGTPAERPSIGTTVTNWRAGDTIPIAADRSLRVVGIVAY
jgi:hypothetical protein